MLEYPDTRKTPKFIITNSEYGYESANRANHKAIFDLVARIRIRMVTDFFIFS